MQNEKIATYNMRTKSRNVTDFQEFVLPGGNQKARKIVRWQVVYDHHKPTVFRGIHLEIIHQKKKKFLDDWEAVVVDPIDMREPENAAISFKVPLDTDQSKALFEELKNAFAVGQDGVSEGERLVVRKNEGEDVIVSDKNRIETLKKLIANSEESEVWEVIEKELPNMPARLALSKIYSDREEALKEFESSLKEVRGEGYWQDFLSKNKWLFNSFYARVISERRLDINNQVDFPAESEGGFLDLIEIKKPEVTFWLTYKNGESYLYREKFLIPALELQGAIAQGYNYILQAEKNIDSKDFSKSHGGLIPLKPRCLVVHGRSNNWTGLEWEAFRLLNDSLHGIEVITFDLLFKRAKRSLEIFKEDSIQN